MLDQNTDRMWYVIGAVLVGAAIILIANSAMPEVFASVGGSFTDVSDRATYEIKTMSGEIENLFHPGRDMYNTLVESNFITYGHNDVGGITVTNPSDTVARAKIRLTDIIPYGSLYAVSFDVRSDAEDAPGIHVDVSDINEYPGWSETIPRNITNEWTSYTMTVRHDGNFDHEDGYTKMNFVDFNIMVEGNSSVELRDIVVAQVEE